MLVQAFPWRHLEQNAKSELDGRILEESARTAEEERDRHKIPGANFRDIRECVALHRFVECTPQIRKITVDCKLDVAEFGFSRLPF